MAYTEITIGATVAFKSKGASTGRTGQVIELNDERARIHWTKKSNGQPMSQRNWIHTWELMVISGGLNRAQQSVANKMDYIIEQIGNGPLTSLEEGELLEILQNLKRGDSILGHSIQKHFDLPADQRDDWEMINGLASQCYDDLFTMVCVVGQAGVILLLRTLK